MNKLVSRIKPKSGFANLLHIALNMFLPLLLYVLVRIDFAILAASLIILSKWRMFAVRPRYWLANIRANAVDIIVGISTVVFMSVTSIAVWQLVWVVLYGVWLIFLKPKSSVLYISLQAGVGQLLGLMALFLVSGDKSLYLLIILIWLVCYLCARHFFSGFDEKYTQLFSHLWAHFAAALMWVLGHWLLFYNVLAQPTLLLVVIGYGLASMYYLDHNDRLSPEWRRQFILMMIAIITVVLTFSDWGDKAI